MWRCNFFIIPVGRLWNSHISWWLTAVTNMYSFLTHQKKEMHQFVSSGIAAVSNFVYMVIRMRSIAFPLVEICWKIHRNWRPSKSVKNPAFSSSFTHLCSLCLIVGSISMWIYRWRYLPGSSFEIGVLGVETGKFMFVQHRSIHICPNNLPIIVSFHL
jgi:hypothetical protein